MQRFGSSVAEAHRLDVFLDSVVDNATNPQLWAMVRWLRDAIGVAGNPLSAAVHSMWPVEESRPKEFQCVSYAPTNRRVHPHV